MPRRALLPFWRGTVRTVLVHNLSGVNLKGNHQASAAHGQARPRGGRILHVEHPRARRYSLIASIELTDLQSETQSRERTSDLSLFGCHVDGGESLPTRTRVRIRIAHKGKIFEAVGRVANYQSNAGIGISFTKVEEKDQSVLEEWIAELRDKQKLPSH